MTTETTNSGIAVDRSFHLLIASWLLWTCTKATLFKTVCKKKAITMLQRHQKVT